MTTPSKHAVLICAWAAGTIIEARITARADSAWTEMDAPGGDTPPGWFDDAEYRIKPAPKLSPEAALLIYRLQVATRADRDSACGSLQEQVANQDMRDAEQALYGYILNLEQKIREPST